MNKIEELIQQLCPDGVEYFKLCEVVKVLRGKRLTKNQLSDDEKFPVYHGGLKPLGYYGQSNRIANTVMVINVGASAGTVGYSSVSYWSSDGCFCIGHSDLLISRYTYYALLCHEDILRSKVRVAGIPTLDATAVENISISIPPLPIQQEIVYILDKFTALEAELEAELEARKKQYEFYRNQLLNFEGKEVEWKTLDEIADNLDSKRRPVKSSDREKGKFPYYGASGVVDNVCDYIFDGDFLLISEDGANLIARNTPIAFSISGKTWVNNHAHVLQFSNHTTRKFVEYYLNSIDLSKYISGAAQPKLNKENLNRIAIPIPPLSEQERIVGILDKFDALVNDISFGLPAEIEARRKQYEYYRGRLLDFKRINNG